MGYDLSELPERYRRQAEEKMQNTECKVKNEKCERRNAGGKAIRTEPYESEEQEALFCWAEALSGRYPCLRLMYHVPNGGQRSAAVAGKLKAEGVKAGVPDICLPVSRGNYHGLYIELKAGRNKATAEQEWWLSALLEEGYKAVVCRGWSSAADVIMDYLGEKERE